LRRFHSARRGT